MHVLAVGAHPDDVELGCGATLLAHRAAGDDVTLLVMTTGERGPADPRGRRAEQEESARMLGARLLWGGFDDGEIPATKDAVMVVESAVRSCAADVVYTHAPNDSHQDHRATAAATLAAARHGSKILCFESPSTLEFAPSVFTDVAEFVEGKLDLVRAHMSQVLECRMVDLEAVEAMARYRGFQARVRHAEAFTPTRFVWDFAAAAPSATRVEHARVTTTSTRAECVRVATDPRGISA